LSTARPLIIEPKQAEAILKSGAADLIAFAREMLVNPNFAAQASLELEGAAGWNLWPDQFRYWLERRAKALRREGRA
jgi:2,4-dienoyl-CoA reductase-like NADH-dependent reductase (Old Yellow Enzyme family)